LIDFYDTVHLYSMVQYCQTGQQPVCFLGTVRQVNGGAVSTSCSGSFPQG
jgi:hypothetical protein